MLSSTAVRVAKVLTRRNICRSRKRFLYSFAKKFSSELVEHQKVTTSYFEYVEISKLQEPLATLLTSHTVRSYITWKTCSSLTEKERGTTSMIVLFECILELH